MITAQNQAELYRILNENKEATSDDRRKVVVVSVSPQSLSSLAVRYNMSISAIAARLSTFLRRLGVHYVLDTVFARDLALRETAQEMIVRYKVDLGVNTILNLFYVLKIKYIHADGLFSLRLMLKAKKVNYPCLHLLAQVRCLQFFNITLSLSVSLALALFLSVFTGPIS